MAENLYIPDTQERKAIYEVLLPQIEALIKDEKDLIANLANVSAALKQAFGFFWVGFYLYKEGELVLGPFQGPIACTRIKLDKGVCGAAFSQNKTLIVADVEQFPGHIACNAASKSEIVLPVGKGGKPQMVLDIDSDQLNDFSEEDQAGLEAIVKLLEAQL